MKRALALVLLLLLPGCLSGPSGEAGPGGTPPTLTPGVTPPSTTPTPSMPTRSTTPPADASEADDLVGANNRFALDAFRTLGRESPRENLVVSPYSIATALQMLYAGAGGSTREAMAEALRLGAAEPTLHEDAKALLENLTLSDANVTLAIGNSLWMERRFAPEVNESYVALVEDAYGGEVHARDFRDPATVSDINAWASNKTQGKIDSVLDSIAQDEVLFLLNAVYFKGAWGASFNESCTHRAPFTTDDGRRVDVDMMCGATGHAFARTEERTVARLPYGEGRFAMYLVMPPNGTQLDAFVAGWNGDLDSGAWSPYVELEMPRLKLATRQLDLRPLLDEMGMGVAFTTNADLSRIAPALAVSRVIHDAVMEVDERGTVAAAVTTVGVVATSLPPPPTHLAFDRPFLVAIRDDATGSILFLAKVHDPTST